MAKEKDVSWKVEDDGTSILLVDLSEADQKERSKELARLIAEHDSLKDEAKAYAARVKVQVDGYNEKIRVLSDAINTGKEKRRVPVRILADPQKGIVKLIRDDTNDVIATRMMTEDERQEELFVPGKKPAPHLRSVKEEKDIG